MSERKKVVLQVRQNARQLVRELDVVKGVYLGTGYTFTQCHVLFEISQNQSLGLMELSDALLIDKSNMSRTVKKLVELGLIKSTRDKADQRQKHFTLTAKGQSVIKATVGIANTQVENALANLDADQHQQVIIGLNLYGEALRKGRLQEGYSVRRIKKKDNAQVASVIREVMTEFGAVGEGYSIEDPEVNDMYGNYKDDRSRYYVIDFDGKVVGCGGVARLNGASKHTCELRKMFFLPGTRGRGLGRRLLLRLLEDARKLEYKKCYLETLERMESAVSLYQNNGFQRLGEPLGRTGHSSCDRYYLLDL